MIGAVLMQAFDPLEVQTFGPIRTLEASMEGKIKGFVLFSGGIDSTTCLALACNRHGDDNVTAIGINYGQRHAKELGQARQICALYGVEQVILDLGTQPQSMLTNPDADIPNASYKELVGISPTYVHFRNGQMLSKIAAYASSKLADDETAIIYAGMHAEDAAGDAYPDCRLDFVGAMAAAIYIGTYHKVRLSTPLIELDKSQVVKWGDELGAPFALSWSCYAGEDVHCGTCPTCRARKEAFFNAGVVDYTIYRA